MDKLYSKKNNNNHLELLISSLLEYFCSHQTVDSSKFKSLNKYMLESGMIEQDFSSNEHSHKRKLYINVLKTLLHNFKNIKNKTLVIDDELSFDPLKKPIDKVVDKDSQIVKSRYYEDFLQISKIGNGGFGIVYKAYNKFDKNYYAIKKIPLVLPFEKVHREVECLSKLDHPNVVRYFNSWIEYDPFAEEVDEYDDFIDILSESSEDGDMIPVNSKELKKSKNKIFLTIFIQMQLCNYTLKDWLNVRNKNISENTRYNLELNNELAIKIFIQILDGVKYVHSKGIIHRDLKTTNIFLDKDLNVKIGDFGLAKKNKIFKSDKLISSSCGTQMYAAPEQYNLGDIDEKADIYSLGIILFELCYPITTEMERVIVLNDIKKGVFPTNFVEHDKLKVLLLLMLKKHSNERLSLNQVIKGIDLISKKSNSITKEQLFQLL